MRAVQFVCAWDVRRLSVLSCLLGSRGVGFGKELALAGSEQAARTELFREKQGTRNEIEVLGNSCLWKSHFSLYCTGII